MLEGAWRSEGGCHLCHCHFPGTAALGLTAHFCRICTGVEFWGVAVEIFFSYVPPRCLAECCTYAQVTSTAAHHTGACPMRSLFAPLEGQGLKEAGGQPEASQAFSRALFATRPRHYHHNLPPDTSLTRPQPLQRPAAAAPSPLSIPHSEASTVYFPPLPREVSAAVPSPFPGWLADSRPRGSRQVRPFAPAPFASFLQLPTADASSGKPSLCQDEKWTVTAVHTFVQENSHFPHPTATTAPPGKGAWPWR